jgi:hypothetical protein
MICLSIYMTNLYHNNNNRYKWLIMLSWALNFHVDIINSNYPSDTCFRTSYTRFTC